MKRRASKKTYILLELMLALALLSLCAIPLIQRPFLSMKMNLNAFVDTELQRLAEVSFAEVKTSLYLNEISWKELMKTKPYLYKESPLSIDFPTYIKKKFKKSILLSREKQAGKKENKFLLTKVLIRFQQDGCREKNREFEYLVNLRKIQ